MQRGIRFGALDADDIKRDETGSPSTSGISLERLEAAQAVENHQITEEQAGFLAQLEHKRAARLAIVPTSDVDVKEYLFIVGEPMILFGEGPYERRERLKELMADPQKDYKRRLEAALEAERTLQKETASPIKAPQEHEEFFVPGSQDLLNARRWLLNYSLNRAASRIQAERQFRSQPISGIKEHRLALYERMKTYKNVASQVGCERPLSTGSFSPDGSLFATGGFGGSLKVWSTADAGLRSTFTGHTGRTNCVKFHPHAGSELTAVEGLAMASSSDDGTIGLWSLQQETPIGVLKGHSSRVPRIQFHPSGLYLGSASFDYSWRLWDLEHQRELQLQEGHSRQVYCIDFHPDGALAGTGGFDSIGRIWDLRQGKAVWTLQGKHVKSLLALKFAPSGYEVATASEDCTVVMWDMRSLRPTYVLPAHNSTVSDLCFTPDGTALVTASYDGTAKVWGRYGWKCLATLGSPEGPKVMSVDISSHSGMIATTSYDRTFKYWQ